MDKQSVIQRLFSPSDGDAMHAIETLSEYIEHAIQYREDAKEMVYNWNKDEEIVKRDRIIEELRHELCHETWSFPKSDRAAAEEFYLKHCRLNHSPYYQFTPTSISTCCEVVCTCGKRFTTYD